VQHALRAFTPRDQKAIEKSAETFRTNPKLDVAKTITQLGVGEALVSFLDDKGAPSVVQRAFVLPPKSKIGPITPEQRKEAIAGSLLYGHYEKMVDRESAYEMLKVRAEEAAKVTAAAEAQKAQEKAAKTAAGRSRSRESIPEAMAKSTVRSIGNSLGRQIVRGILGGILGGRRKY
jgi:DNA double-strand break repair helicase HerA and related ATPase